MFEDIIYQLRRDRYRDGVAESMLIYYPKDKSIEPCKTKTGLWLKALELIKAQMNAGTLCLCEEEVSNIYYGAKQYLGPNCEEPVKDFTTVDRADKDLWIVQNPECVVYEYWVDALRAECERVGINIKVKESQCAALGLDIKVVYQEVCNELELRLIVEEVKCDLGIDISLKEVEQCKLDYDVKIVPLECNVDLKTVVKAVACGLDLDVIAKELACGLSLNVTAEGVDFCPAQIVEPEIPVLDFDLAADDLTICYYTDVEITLSNITHPYSNYDFDFGVDSVVISGSGLGPYVIQYTSAGTKTVTVTATAGDQEEIRTIHITVSSCPGSLAGKTMDTFGNGIQGTNVRLYSDANEDGVADDAVILRSVLSTVSGTWTITGLTPGSYVVVAIKPQLYNTVYGEDISDDWDNVPDLDTTDLVIPVTVLPSEIDSGLNFVFTPEDGTISGTVFDDLSNPIENAEINIYEDFDLDGIADGPAIATVLTNASGAYTASGIPAGKWGLGSVSRHYIIELTLPVGFSIVSGIDASNDSDLVANSPTTDNIIPCTLNNGETDANNDFIIHED